MTWHIPILGAIGLILSVQMLQLRGKKKEWCDFSSKISCTKAANAKEANLFGRPSAAWGVAFYLLTILLFAASAVELLLALVSIGLGRTIYLIWLSWKMQNFCLLCTAAYLVNIALFVLSWGMV